MLPVVQRLVFVGVCLVLPVAVGVAVNWLFDLWHKRRAEREDDRESVFPDYQI